MKFFVLLLLFTITVLPQEGAGDIQTTRKGDVPAELLMQTDPDALPLSDAFPHPPAAAVVKDTSGEKSLLPKTLMKKRVSVPSGIGRDYVNRVAVKDKLVALTFDDGPLKTTPALMNMLRVKNVRATFFIVTQNLSKGNAYLYNQLDTLFEFAMHSHRHPQYPKIKPEEREEDLNNCLQTFKRHNLWSNLFRPPYGAYNTEVTALLKKNNLRGVLWDIDTEDWRNYHGRDIVKFIDESLRSGSIILFHDRVNLADLEKVIALIESRGYSFVTVSELLNAGHEHLLAKIKAKADLKKIAVGKQ